MASILSKKFFILLLLLLAIGGGVWKFSNRGPGETRFRTVEVKKGDLTVSISSTGTVEPEEVIDVGAQVAGLIFAFGKDDKGKQVDYGSEVEAGTVLAQIDDSLYAADVATAQAQFSRAKADLATAKAKLAQAERDWGRAQKLLSSDALSQANFDGYRAAYDSAQANILVADAGIAQAEATLKKAQRNLSLCTITSPVKGVIIDRRVNIGQTVVSSLNAPSLFLLAKDLRHMQVWVSVNEADIGNIHLGQKVEFTVDAFPGETFTGQVGKIRLNATMTQNVVTYTVEVQTDNSSLRLLPYLTANTRFLVSQHENVLLVPNAALRWAPGPDLVEASANGPAAPSKTGPGNRNERGTLWKAVGSKVAPLSVEVLGTDGTFSEVRGDITEGTQVVIGSESKESAPSGTTNPFAPQPFRKKNTQ